MQVLVVAQTRKGVGEREEGKQEERVSRSRTEY